VGVVIAGLVTEAFVKIYRMVLAGNGILHGCITVGYKYL